MPVALVSIGEKCTLHGDKNVDVGGKIVWVGGYPAHYMRKLHCALELKLPDKLEFIYVGSGSSKRTYEQGEFPKSSIILTRKTPWEIFRILSKYNPHSIIVAGHYPRPLLYTALWGFFKRRNVLYWADTNLLDILSKNVVLLWIRRTLFKVYFRRMYCLLYMGNRTRDYYVWVCGRQFVKTKLKWLPLPELISQSKNEVKQGDQDNLLHVLYIGRLASEKAIDKLIQAFALLSPEIRAKVRLRVAGDGPEKSTIEKLVHDLCLEDVVEILGSVASDQTAHLFNQSSIFVLPSHHDAWGVVVSEAMAAGLPVIAPFWVGAVADLVVNGHAGIVINDNSPEEIVRAIEYFIEFPEETKRMGKEAQEIIKNGNWGLDGAVNAFDRIITELKNKS